MVIETYNPLSIICQCGADGLAYDEMDSFNLSSEAYVECIKLILDSRLPTLLLGGGEHLKYSQISVRNIHHYEINVLMNSDAVNFQILIT